MYGRPMAVTRRISSWAVGLASLSCFLLFASDALGADSVYWSNVGGNAIRVANLDGSGSAATLFAGETFPEGVAIDPSTGKIYWATNTSIRVANLDGSGAATLFSGESGPYGIQIDTTARGRSRQPRCHSSVSPAARQPDATGIRERCPK